jgi:hypothetical protein
MAIGIEGLRRNDGSGKVRLGRRWKRKEETRLTGLHNQATAINTIK